MRFDSREKVARKKENFTKVLKWHRWFAWFPVKIEESYWIWFGYCDRRVKYTTYKPFSSMPLPERWEYRTLETH